MKIKKGPLPLIAMRKEASGGPVVF